MSKDITIIDSQYKEWIADLSKRYRQHQVKAAVKVNTEMLRFYWSLGRDIVKDVVKEVEIELSERQLNIIALLALNPTTTIPEMSGKMSGKKPISIRTIERDIAYLQNHGIIKREGGRKEGRWVVLRSSTTFIS